MMYRIYGLILFTLSLITFCGCTMQKGCIDSRATDFCPDCDKDDGSCTFRGRAVFWYAEGFELNNKHRGTAKIQVYIDNVLSGTLNVVAASRTSAPACGDDGALTISKD